MGFIWVYGVPKDWIVKLMSALARSGRFVWPFHYPVFQELVLLCLSLPEKMFHLLDLGNIGGAGKKYICGKALHFTFQSECYTKEISTRHVRRMHTLSNVNMSYVHRHVCMYKLENTEGTNKAGQHWNTLTVQA